MSQPAQPERRCPIVVSVDPGLSRCGIAVLTGTSAKPQLIASDVVRTTANDDHSQRLAMIFTGLERIVQRFTPDVMAVERIFINKQANTGIGAVQVVGFVHLLAAQRDIPVVEYTPSQVKMAVTGSGEADKRAVGDMVMRTLGLPERPTPADRADAMAVGLCHLSQPAYVQSHPLLAGNGPRQATKAAGNTRLSSGMNPRLALLIEQASSGLAPAPKPRKREA